MFADPNFMIAAMTKGLPQHDHARSRHAAQNEVRRQPGANAKNRQLPMTIPIQDPTPPPPKPTPMLTTQKIKSQTYTVIEAKHYMKSKREKKKQMLTDDLTVEQKYIVELVRNRKNVFYTGEGGTGKTYLMRYLIQMLNDHIKEGERIRVLGPTGTSALLIGGSTISSFIGLSKREMDMGLENILTKSNQFGRIRRKWLETTVMVIDELSMVTKELFETMNTIAQYIRKSDAPFGGILLICGGDFFQLPPVSKSTEPEYCFESTIFHDIFPLEGQCVYLTTPFRQTDPTFLHLLGELRMGKLSEESREIMADITQRTNDRLSDEGFERRGKEREKKRKKKEDDEDDEPKKKSRKRLKPVEEDDDEEGDQKRVKQEVDDTPVTPSVRMRLCTHNYQADRYNMLHFNELPEEPTFTYRPVFKAGARQHIPNFHGKSEPAQYHRARTPVYNHNKDSANQIKHKYVQMQELKTESNIDKKFLEDGLKLRLGTRVILKVNLNQNLGLINGAQGKVVGFDGWHAGMKLDTKKYVCYPVVDFDHGVTAIMKPYIWFNDSKYITMELHHIPLEYAWAITIHSAQGATYDGGDVQIDKAFVDAQCYVAVSRFRSLDDLGIVTWNENRIHANPKIHEFDARIRTASARIFKINDDEKE